MSIYMLLDKKRHASMMLRVIPLNYRERAVIIMQKVEKKLGRWVQAQLLLSVIIFIISYFSLSVLHIKFALTISLIAGFCEIIPIAGSIVANTIAVILTLFISPDKVIYVLIIAILIHQLEAHVLVPQVMRKVIGLSPLITIISLIIGAELVGFIGAVLSVPIAAIFQILYLEIFKND